VKYTNTNTNIQIPKCIFFSEMHAGTVNPFLPLIPPPPPLYHHWEGAALSYDNIESDIP
jgi:hypothetical protein